MLIDQTPSLPERDGDVGAPTARATPAAIRHLRAFIGVARHRSFTRAAKQLHLSQPALTMAVRQLEDFVGASLFERTTRVVTLTKEGLDFLPTAERIIDDFDLAIQDVQAAANRRRGRVAIAAVSSIAAGILPTAVRAISISHPSIRVQLRDGNSDDVRHRVRRSEVDVGVCSRGEEEPELSYSFLFKDELGLLAKADHPLCMKRQPLSWRDLDGYDFIGFSADTATWPLIGRVPGLPQSVASPRYEVSNYPPAWAMLLADNGITIAGALSAPAGEGKELRFRRIEEPKLWRSVFIVKRRGRSLTRVAEELVEEIRRVVSSRESELIRLQD
jgi:LysR family carnitine catabolism transcriptional activator